MVRVLVVVDGDPLVAGAQPVALAVVVREGVVVFEAVFEHEFGAFLGGFPPDFLRGVVSESHLVVVGGMEGMYQGATMPRGGLPCWNSVMRL